MKVKQLTLVSLMIALSVLGGYFKIFGSIALDTAPAILGTILLSPTYGIVLAFLGHMSSALLSGFPLSLPIHLIIGVMMSLTLFVFGKVRGKRTNKKTMIMSDIVLFIFNVFVAQIPLIPILCFGVLSTLLVPLSLATVINIVAAEVIYYALPDRLIMDFQPE